MTIEGQRASFQQIIWQYSLSLSPISLLPPVPANGLQTTMRTQYQGKHGLYDYFNHCFCPDTHKNMSAGRLRHENQWLAVCQCHRVQQVDQCLGLFLNKVTFPALQFPNPYLFAMLPRIPLHLQHSLTSKESCGWLCPEGHFLAINCH